MQPAAQRQRGSARACAGRTRARAAHRGDLRADALLACGALLVLLAPRLLHRPAQLLLVLERGPAQLGRERRAVRRVGRRARVERLELARRARGRVRPARLGQHQSIALNIGEHALHPVGPAVRVHGEGLGDRGRHRALLPRHRLRARRARARRIGGARARERTCPQAPPPLPGSAARTRSKRRCMSAKGGIAGESALMRGRKTSSLGCPPDPLSSFCARGPGRQEGGECARGRETGSGERGRAGRAAKQRWRHAANAARTGVCARVALAICWWRSMRGGSEAAASFSAASRATFSLRSAASCCIWS